MQIDAVQDDAVHQEPEQNQRTGEGTNDERMMSRLTSAATSEPEPQPLPSQGSSSSTQPRKVTFDTRPSASTTGRNIFQDPAQLDGLHQVARYQTVRIQLQDRIPDRA